MQILPESHIAVSLWRLGCQESDSQLGVSQPARRNLHVICSEWTVGRGIPTLEARGLQQGGDSPVPPRPPPPLPLKTSL